MIPTDTDIKNIITELKLCSVKQITAQWLADHPGQERDTGRIKKIIYSLARYQIVEYIDRGQVRYYYLAGQVPDVLPPDTYKARVSEFLTAQAPQAYSAIDLAQITGATKKAVNRILKELPVKVTPGRRPLYSLEVGA